MATLPAGYDGATTFSFGDTPELADELLALVLAGHKTATCGALRHVEAGEPMPVVGRRDVVVDSLGRSACAIETTEVAIHRFDDVPRDFAEAEGEGGYDGWRAGHIAYFGRNGGWSPDMMVVCERFRVVEVFPR